MSLQSSAFNAAPGVNPGIGLIKHGAVSLTPRVFFASCTLKCVRWKAGKVEPSSSCQKLYRAKIRLLQLAQMSLRERKSKPGARKSGEKFLFTQQRFQIAQCRWDHRGFWSEQGCQSVGLAVFTLGKPKFLSWNISAMTT